MQSVGVVFVEECRRTLRTTWGGCRTSLLMVVELVVVIGGLLDLQ